MKKCILIVLAVWMALVVISVRADTFVNAGVFSPSNVNLDGANGAVSYFPTDILDAQTGASVSVSGAGIGDAKFDGSGLSLAYRGRDFAIGLTTFSVGSRTWSDSFGSQMRTWGHWSVLTGAYQANPQFRLGLSIGLEGRFHFRDSMPSFTDWDGTTVPGSVMDERISENNPFVVGAEWNVSPKVSVIGAYGARRLTDELKFTDTDGSDPEPIDPMKSEETRMTIAMKYRYDKLQAIIGFQGSEETDEWSSHNGLLRSFLGIGYRCAENLSVRIGTCRGSRDIGATWNIAGWVINAVYMHNGINSADDTNSQWALGIGKTF